MPESRPLATMENFLALSAWTFSTRSSARAAASKAGPIFADVAGRLMWNAFLFFMVSLFCDRVRRCATSESRHPRLAPVPGGSAAATAGLRFGIRAEFQRKDLRDGTLGCTPHLSAHV